MKAASAKWRPQPQKPPTFHGHKQTWAGTFSVICARGQTDVAMPKIKDERTVLQSTFQPLPLESRIFHQHGCHLIRPGFISYLHIVRPPLLRASQHNAFRRFGTGGKANGSKQEPETQESSKPENRKEDGKQATEEFAKEVGPPESLDPKTFLLGTTARIKKVADWQVGDEIATYAIAVLLGLIILGPIMAHYMRRSDNNYDEPYTDDQVVDMARIVKRDFLDKISTGEGLEDKGMVHSVIADVLSSKSLQEQAIKFVVTIVSSEEVKAVCQTLLQDLWNDLIKDPETTAQVIFLLNAAIQNEDIRFAVKNLVLEIVEDEEVLEELVRLLQKLGQDQDVLDATKSLLTESTHNALNDPQILDHSMEFAADVVGDDVVQRTAGEALRNSLSYAVQPGMSIRECLFLQKDKMQVLPCL
jgi:sorbitol-specific phosphotransferase system component IIC